MKSKHLKTVVVSFGITILASTSMFAQREERGDKKERPSTEELFKMMDKDEDAKLSKEEVEGPLKQHFDEIDSNEDGFLTAEELENAPKPERRQRDRS